MRTKSHEIPERYKITIIAILLTGCLCLTFYTHLILKTGVICTHFFYVPIVLSAIWWKRKGIVVAVCSGVAVILSSAVFLETDLMNNFLRGFVFVVISFVVAMLSERIAKGEKELRKSEKKYRSIFENSVEEAFSILQTFLANSITANCIPKQSPKNGILFFRQNSIVFIFPSTPLLPNPPGTIIPA